MPVQIPLFGTWLTFGKLLGAWDRDGDLIILMIILMIRTKVETCREICSDFMKIKDLKESVEQEVI